MRQSKNKANIERCIFQKKKTALLEKEVGNQCLHYRHNNEKKIYRLFMGQFPQNDIASQISKAGVSIKTDVLAPLR